MKTLSIILFALGVLFAAGVQSQTPLPDRPIITNSQSPDVAINELSALVIWGTDLLVVFGIVFAFFRGVKSGGSIAARGFNRGSGEL